MPAIGDMLREARMRQGLDITDVEASTKIRAKYLRALENEEWGMLPGSTFVKTFLRTYSEALGLDPHFIVEEYRTHHEEPDELELQPFATQASAGGAGPRRDRRPGPPPPGVVLGLIVAAVLAFLIVLGLSGDDDEPGQSASEDATTERERPAREQPRERPAPTRVALRIAPDGDTYICVDRGEETETLFEGTIADPQTFRGRRLRVNLGRRAVELRVNGEPVEIEPSSEPVGYEFTPGRTRELPEAQRPCT
jgi:cytoskeletal protein RodZ